ncbi:MAG: DUF3987 domain-containing protein [Sphingomonas sp.]|uniref:DUF3987 domain-containing protein n=1 Tax=Sphingomonas sp. TaxID=28214 RepID=UPI001AC12175|nr:DUF3987 domain-containing protein [Sphingomonas sp.]MBN8806651.1 DUF3987 domain-containing protein [Sphingomonas sp.]
MSDVTPPPGLVGEVAQFIYAAAPRQIEEVALAGAIGFVAGIVGRSHNVNGTGLNQYVLVLADTGMGKEAAASGIGQIISALTKPSPGNPFGSAHAASFVGPSDMASGQGLLRTLSRRKPPSFVSIVGEFGLRFAQMAQPRVNAADAALLRVMLDLYNKSGEGRVLGETVYSEKERDTAAIVAPAVSFLCESTPSTFFENLSEAMITNGLLPRFIIMEFKGKRPARNKEADKVRPELAMLERIANLMSYCASANQNNSVTHVTMASDAEEYLDRFDLYCDERHDEATNDVNRELYSRAHMKAVKLAGLIAVGGDFENPIVTLDIAMWATAQIERDIARLIVRFDSGDIGVVAGNEAKQEQAVLRCIHEYQHGEFKRFANYGVSEEMHNIGAFTQTYISKRVRNLPAFDDKIGRTKAIERVLHSLAHTSAVIQEFSTEQTLATFGTRARTFIVNDFDAFNAMLRSP